MKRAEVLSIGDELLRGIVQDTNSHWIVQRLTARGASVERVTMLPDDPDVVASALRAAVQGGVDVVTTHGGLGPTDDDRTREALSRATGLACELHPEAEAIVRRRYAELHASGAVDFSELNDARMRMALLPAGAIALDNHVGAAPGIVLGFGDTTIISLPGVPPEMKWIFENSLAPVLDELLGPGGFVEWTAVASTNDESTIAAVLADVQRAHPDVYVKSRAKAFGEQDQVRITLTAAGESSEAARRSVSAAQAQLARALEGAGVTLTEL